MSTSKRNQEKVRLIADGQEPGTEIYVIDGNFNVKTKGIDSLDISLPPGLYKVKFKRGSVISEVGADLFPESKDVEVSAPIMEFSSPVPLHGTDTSHEYHQAEAENLSRQKQVNLGKGSQLLLFVRDVDTAGQGNIVEGLSLHDIQGRKVVDFASEAERAYEQNKKMASWAGCNIELDPGCYRLRLSKNEDETLEQLVVLVQDWQTQVFLVRNWYGVIHDEGKTKRKEWPELSKSSILMAPIGQGFRSSDDELRLIELARQGLFSGRTVVRIKNLEGMLRKKSLNPMLGIFGAYLLLPQSTQSNSIDPAIQNKLKSLLLAIVESLKYLLGDHPDVRALDLYLNQPIPGDLETMSFTIPPMLKRSWKIIVDKSILKTGLVPAGSLAGRIADRLWGGGPWVIWQTPPVARRPAKDESLSQLEKAVKKMEKRLDGYDDLEEISSKMNLNDLENALLSYLYLNVPDIPKKRDFKGKKSIKTKPPLDKIVTQDLMIKNAVQTFGMPASTTNWAAESIIRKMKKEIKGNLI